MAGGKWMASAAIRMPSRQGQKTLLNSGIGPILDGGHPHGGHEPAQGAGEQRGGQLATNDRWTPCRHADRDRDRPGRPSGTLCCGE